MNGLRRVPQHPKTRSVQQRDGSFREEPLELSKGEIEFVGKSPMRWSNWHHPRKSKRLAQLAAISFGSWMPGFFPRVGVLEVGRRISITLGGEIGLCGACIEFEYARHGNLIWNWKVRVLVVVGDTDLFLVGSRQRSAHGDSSQTLDDALLFALGYGALSRRWRWCCGSGTSLFRQPRKVLLSVLQSGYLGARRPFQSIPNHRTGTNRPATPPNNVLGGLTTLLLGQFANSAIVAFNFCDDCLTVHVAILNLNNRDWLRRPPSTCA